MKYIATTLLLIVGVQVSLNAELFYYEKIFEETISKEFTDQERDERDASYNQLREELEIGNIRLEEGELLSKPSQKMIRSPIILNGWRANSQSLPHFKLIINYDRFSKDEVYKITNEENFKWSFAHESGLVFSQGNEWPIEGPATVKVLVKPHIAPLYINNGGYKYKYFRPEQFLRISFTKSLSQFRVSQNQLQALVLPKGVQGMSVIMESSEDLVNWTLDTLGPKATADRPKFFRLRAIKQ
jgi:hypothetical protein